jgi:hypothetical protein
LIRDHLANANNQIAEGLGCSPVIADADRAWVNIRVEDRREHLAVGRTMRVRTCQDDFRNMGWGFDDLPVVLQNQAADPIFDFVTLRRIASDLANGDELAGVEPCLYLFIVGLQSSKSNAHCRSRSHFHCAAAMASIHSTIAANPM